MHSSTHDTQVLDRGGAEAARQAGGGCVHEWPLAGDCTVEPVTEPGRLEALVPQWRALREAALVPAIAQEPAWVFAAERSMTFKGLVTFAVWGPDDGAAETPELIGMLTARPAPWRWGLPEGPHRSMINGHVFNGTPLLHREHDELALTALFRQVRTPFLLDSVAEAAPLNAVLETALAASGREMRRCDTFARGVWTCTAPSETYLKDTHSKGRRGKFRRWRRQLGELGNLRFVSLDPEQDLEPWWREFLALEAKGWKGRQGTAVANSPVTTEFFHTAVSILHGEGRLHWWKLTLDGRAVAMLFGMRHHRHISLGKITYDEDHARFTPGALLLLDVMDWAFARGDVDFIDACGRPGNAMIDALWTERLGVSDVLISAPHGPPALFAVQCAAEEARRRLRAHARDVRDRIRLRSGRRKP